jgi:hypothetical protein
MKLWEQIIPSELGAVKRTKVIEASGFGVYSPYSSTSGREFKES